MANAQIRHWWIVTCVFQNLLQSFVNLNLISLSLRSYVMSYHLTSIVEKQKSLKLFLDINLLFK